MNARMLVALPLVLCAFAKRADAGDAVAVVVEGSEDVLLQRQQFDAWENVCFGECRASVPVGSTLRIGGPGTVASAPFVVHGDEGSVATLHVKRATSVGLTSGITLASYGATAIPGGALLVAVFGGLRGWFSDLSWYASLGGVFIATGSLALLTGVMLIALNSSTHVSVTTSPQGRPDSNVEAAPTANALIPLVRLAF